MNRLTQIIFGCFLISASAIGVIFGGILVKEGHHLIFGCFLIAASAIGGIYGGILLKEGHRRRKKEQKISNESKENNKETDMGANDKNLNVGDDSVVMGNVSGNVGNRSVVVGPTDNKGNTILNQPGAFGYNAHAGPDSIAIGAHAGGGSDIDLAFSEIHKIIIASKDEKLIKSFKELASELSMPKKGTSKISRLWNEIKESTVLNEALGLVMKISEHINSFTNDT